VVFTANHLTDIDKQNSTGKYKQTQYKSEKVNNLKYSKTKLPWSVASYNTRPGNEVGLFYNALEPTRGATARDHRLVTGWQLIPRYRSVGKNTYETEYSQTFRSGYRWSG